MNLIDAFLGMPWTEYITIWKTAVGVLFGHYLILTVLAYIIFVVIICYMGLSNSLANYTLGFFFVVLLFATPLSRLFAGIEVLLRTIGIQLPGAFK